MSPHIQAWVHGLDSTPWADGGIWRTRRGVGIPGNWVPDRRGGQPDAKQNGHVGAGPVTQSHKSTTTESYRRFRNGPHDTDHTQCPRTTKKMGSWNVRTLSEAGALKKLDDALATLSMDLVALQEIRWLGNGVHNRRGKHCYDIYYSCHDRHRVLGTGFAAGPRLEPAIMDFKAINDRLSTLRMQGKFFNISLINVHASTEDKEEEEKDLFYGRLARIIDVCPRHDLKIILGDFNRYRCVRSSIRLG